MHREYQRQHCRQYILNTGRTKEKKERDHFLEFSGKRLILMMLMLLLLFGKELKIEEYFEGI
jgi:hypothetical protein